MIGEKVTIKDRNGCYDEYAKWAELHDFELNVSRLPVNGSIGTVIACGKHTDYDNMLYGVEIDGLNYIMASDSISISAELVFSHNNLIMDSIKEEIADRENYDQNILISHIKELVSKLIQEQL